MATAYGWAAVVAVFSVAVTGGRADTLASVLRANDSDEQTTVGRSATLLSPLNSMPDGRP